MGVIDIRIDQLRLHRCHLLLLRQKRPQIRFQRMDQKEDRHRHVDYHYRSLRI